MTSLTDLINEIQGGFGQRFPFAKIVIPSAYGDAQFTNKDFYAFLDQALRKVAGEVIKVAADEVRKCQSPDRIDEKNKLFEARLIYRIEAIDAVTSLATSFLGE